MLKSARRLSAKEVEQLFAHNTRIRGKYIQLVYTSAEDTKAAAIVGKKIVKRAVRRNYHRRRIYHALGNYWHMLQAPLHLAVILTPQGAEALFAELESDIVTLLKQLPQ